MRRDYRVAVSIYCNNATINFDIPVFALSGDVCCGSKNLLTAECNNIFYIITQFEITTDTVYAHGCRVEFFDIFYQIIFQFVFLTGCLITVSYLKLKFFCKSLRSKSSLQEQ